MQQNFVHGPLYIKLTKIKTEVKFGLKSPLMSMNEALNWSNKCDVSEIFRVH